jgi:hypothetical protein
LATLPSDLMAFGVHLRDDTGPVLINGALAKVVAGDEESSTSIILFELLQYILGVDVWTVVVSNSDLLGVQALANTDATIFDVSELGPSILSGGCSVWSFVCIASRTKVDETIRSGAVFFADTTVSRSRAAKAVVAGNTANLRTTSTFNITALASLELGICSVTNM